MPATVQADPVFHAFQVAWISLCPLPSSQCSAQSRQM
jgi:hypothetical protein